MATQKKNTVDYFPHIIGNGKKIGFIEKKYGNDGYAIWFKILESLASADNHFLDLNDEIEISYLAARCNVEEDRLISVVNDLVKIKVFDVLLWENRVIWCNSFVQSIEDAYKRRSNKCMQYADIINLLNSNGFNIVYNMQTSCVHNENNEPKIVNNYPQSKVNKSKEEESKEEENRVGAFVVSKSDDIPQPNPWGVFESMDDLEKVLLSRENWKAEFGKSLGLPSPEDVPKWIEKFFSFCRGSGKTHEKESDAKSHCFSWTRRQIELGKNIENVVIAQGPDVGDGGKPTRDGTTKGELIGKWIWLNNGWRDTSTFTADQKRRNGLK